MTGHRGRRGAQRLPRAWRVLTRGALPGGPGLLCLDYSRIRNFLHVQRGNGVVRAGLEVPQLDAPVAGAQREEVRQEWTPRDVVHHFAQVDRVEVHHRRALLVMPQLHGPIRTAGQEDAGVEGVAFHAVHRPLVACVRLEVGLVVAAAALVDVSVLRAGEVDAAVVPREIQAQAGSRPADHPFRVPVPLQLHERAERQALLQAPLPDAAVGADADEHLSSLAAIHPLELPHGLHVLLPLDCLRLEHGRSEAQAGALAAAGLRPGRFVARVVHLYGSVVQADRNEGRIARAEVDGRHADARLDDPLREVRIAQAPEQHHPAVLVVKVPLAVAHREHVRIALAVRHARDGVAVRHGALVLPQQIENRVARRHAGVLPKLLVRVVAKAVEGGVVPALLGGPRRGPKLGAVGRLEVVQHVVGRHALRRNALRPVHFRPGTHVDLHSIGIALPSGLLAARERQVPVLKMTLMVHALNEASLDQQQARRQPLTVQHFLGHPLEDESVRVDWLRLVRASAGFCLGTLTCAAEAASLTSSRQPVARVVATVRDTSTSTLEGGSSEALPPSAGCFFPSRMLDAFHDPLLAVWMPDASPPWAS
eukprot:scaffold564_cov248-Pinguiococcus_pyrenoidosus.AAC.5